MSEADNLRHDLASLRALHEVTNRTLVVTEEKAADLQAQLTAAHSQVTAMRASMTQSQVTLQQVMTEYNDFKDRAVGEIGALQQRVRELEGSE